MYGPLELSFGTALNIQKIPKKISFIFIFLSVKIYRWFTTFSPLRRSTRPHRQPPHLQEYTCALSSILFRIKLLMIILMVHTRSLFIRFPPLTNPNIFIRQYKFQSGGSYGWGDSGSWVQSYSITFPYHHTRKLLDVGGSTKYNVKFRAHGTVERYKAPLVAKGYTQ